MLWIWIFVTQILSCLQGIFTYNVISAQWICTACFEYRSEALLVLCVFFLKFISGIVWVHEINVKYANKKIRKMTITPVPTAAREIEKYRFNSYKFIYICMWFIYSQGVVCILYYNLTLKNSIETSLFYCLFKFPMHIKWRNINWHKFWMKR